VVERDTPSCSHPVSGWKGYILIFTPCWWWKGIHSRVHTLLVVERDTLSRLHCWLWTGILSHAYSTGGGQGYKLHVLSAGDGKGEWDTPSRLNCWLWKVIHSHAHPCWWWKEIHSHVAVDSGNENTPKSTLCWFVEKYIPL
jgi:hypothetical protein